MAVIRSFRELKVYQAARAEVAKLFEITCIFPKVEQFALTDQVRRSSRAVKAMIAEAWAKRRYEAAFISKLTDALGEAGETQSWLDDALDCQYITPEPYHRMDTAWQYIGGMLNRMIEKSATFCAPTGG